MQNINTHYDNLKVARNAPVEVIRAAYKILSQKYHPDRNPDNPDAARIMAIINVSFDVLSDPDKRKQHDIWIAGQESAQAVQNKTHQNPQPTKVPKTTTPINYKSVASHVLRHWVLYGIAVIVIWANLTDKPRSPPSGSKPYIANPPPPKLLSDAEVFGTSAATNNKLAPAPGPNPFDDPNFGKSAANNKSTPAPAYEGFLYAPNGAAWPTVAGYVKGYKKLNTAGLSSVTVDNTQNDSNVFVKLVSLNGANAYPARQFFIPAYGKFKVNNITSGGYDVRYRDLTSGSLSRSESFSLEESTTAEGTRFSNITMTLYKVRNGNMQTYGLSEAEF